jgi:glycosyltransferase involved in cell wall biosynthesis
VTALDVSVVICAFNEERHIGRLMESLRHQSLLPKEVIVVDDGSSDRTAAIAEHSGAAVIHTAHRGPANGRNIGCAAASGDVVVFVDGDMSCGRDYVRGLAEPIMRGEAVGTFTRDIYVGQPANSWSRAYCHIRRLGYPRLLPPGFPDRWANFRAVSRHAFLAAGGYDDVGYGEDMTLAPKLGELALAVSGAHCWHFNPDGPREIFENARWIARGHDVRLVECPVRDNLPTRALLNAIADWRGGAPHTVFLARQIYSAGFLLGLLQRRLRPDVHAK